MKRIVIFQNNLEAEKFLTTSSTPDDWFINKAEAVRRLLDIIPDEDIRGLVLPCAKENPELEEILLAIWRHKHNLWQRDVLRSADLLEFKMILSHKFKIRVQVIL